MVSKLSAGAFVIGAVLAGANAATFGVVLDDFSGGTLDSAWTVSGTRLDVMTAQVGGGELRWSSPSWGTGDSQLDTNVSTTVIRNIGFDASSVSADLCWGSALWNGDMSNFGFGLIAISSGGKEISVTISSVYQDTLAVKISYDGVDYWKGTTATIPQDAYHNYAIAYTETDHRLAVYIDGKRVWRITDEDFGAITYLGMQANRWWAWHYFSADNIAATAVPEPLSASLLLIGLPLLAKKRKH